LIHFLNVVNACVNFFNACINTLINAFTIIADVVVDYTERISAIVIDELVAVSYDRDNSDGMAMKQYLIA